MRDFKLTLIQAIEKCRSSEVSQRQVRRIDGTDQSTATVHYATKQTRAEQLKKGKQPRELKPFKKRPCHYCGGKHSSSDKSKCPAYGQICSKFQKKNHFAKICQGEKTHKAHMVQSAEDSSSDDSVYQIHTVGSVKSQGKKWLVTMPLERITPQSKKSYAKWIVDQPVTS